MVLEETLGGGVHSDEAVSCGQIKLGLFHIVSRKPKCFTIHINIKMQVIYLHRYLIHFFKIFYTTFWLASQTPLLSQCVF